MELHDAGEPRSRQLCFGCADHKPDNSGNDHDTGALRDVDLDRRALSSLATGSGILGDNGAGRVFREHAHLRDLEAGGDELVSRSRVGQSDRVRNYYGRQAVGDEQPDGRASFTLDPLPGFWP